MRTGGGQTLVFPFGFKARPSASWQAAWLVLGFAAAAVTVGIVYHAMRRGPPGLEAAAIRLLVTFTRQSMSTLTGWIETTAEPS